MTLQDVDLSYRNGNLYTGHGLEVGGTFQVDGATTLGATSLGATTATSIQSASIAGSCQASDMGLIAWTFDPAMTSGTSTSGAGTIYLNAVYIRYATTVNKLWFIINAAGVTPTAGANNLGLYSSAGTLLGSVNVDSTVASTGPHSGTLSSGVAVTAGMYWVAMQFTAGTQPGIARAGAATLSSITLNQTAATYRYATNGTGTTLPASITPASNSTTGSFAGWAGIS